MLLPTELEVRRPRVNCPGQHRTSEVLKMPTSLAVSVEFQLDRDPFGTLVGRPVMLSNRMVSRDVKKAVLLFSRRARADMASSPFLSLAMARVDAAPAYVYKHDRYRRRLPSWTCQHNQKKVLSLSLYYSKRPVTLTLHIRGKRCGVAMIRMFSIDS